MNLVLVVIIQLVLFIWLSVVTFHIYKTRQRHSPDQNISGPSGFRVGLVKFSPFSDTGGDQSFVISLLDGGGNGILITSLHARGVTRLYAKRVTRGKTEQSLSHEEKAALSQVTEL